MSDDVCRCFYCQTQRNEGAIHIDTSLCERLKTTPMENDITDRMLNHAESHMCVRPLACGCPGCVERYGPIHPGNVGKDLRQLWKERRP